MKKDQTVWLKIFLGKGRNMKKYLLVILMAIFILSLAACSRGDASEGMTEPEPLECDWTLHVDDTITEVVEGIPIAHTLIIDAYKKGGTDDLGLYEGTVTLSSRADLSALTNEAFSVTGDTGGMGSDDAAKLEIIGYDVVKYSPGLELAPLIEYNGMSLGVFYLKGYGYINMNMTGKDGIQGSGNEQFESSVPIEFKLLVNGGKVSIEIPSLKSVQTFDGMITGNPKE
jgi:hypothetical protein